MTEVGQIITLEDNHEYLVLETTERDGIKYLYTVRVLIDETPTDEYVIFKYETDDSGEYLAGVEDKELYDDLFEEFKEIAANKLIDELGKNGSN